MMNDSVLAVLTAALSKHQYPLSYLSELINYLGISTNSAALSTKQEDLLQNILHSLSQQMPVEYIVGEALFYERRFKVTQDVLIPRFDTEELVTKGLEFAKQTGKNITVIDIGTGSGALIITMAKELTNFVNAKYIAIDISEQALAIARLNAVKHGVLEQIEFQNADTYPRNDKNYPLIPESDSVLILANPPYISDKHMITLPDSVKNYEPDLALREQPDFIAKLGSYLSSLEEAKKTIYLCLEYNNKDGVMLKHFVNNQNWRSILNSLANKSL